MNEKGEAVKWADGHLPYELEMGGYETFHVSLDGQDQMGLDLTVLMAPALSAMPQTDWFLLFFFFLLFEQ